jgi:hypothetical protein
MCCSVLGYCKFSYFYVGSSFGIMMLFVWCHCL